MTHLDLAQSPWASLVLSSTVVVLLVQALILTPGEGLLPLPASPRHKATNKASTLISIWQKGNKARFPTGLLWWWCLLSIQLVSTRDDPNKVSGDVQLVVYHHQPVSFPGCIRISNPAFWVLIWYISTLTLLDSSTALKCTYAGRQHCCILRIWKIYCIFLYDNSHNTS